MQTPSTSYAPSITGPWHRISVAFFGAGWLISAWLLLGALAKAGRKLPFTRAALPQAFCSGCDTTLGSAQSWQLGIPLGGWGLIYFAVVGLLVMFGTTGAISTAFLLAALGTGVSLVLAGVTMSSPQTCAVCLLVHVANVGLLASLWLTLSKATPSLAAPVFGSKRLSVLVAGFAILTGALLEGALWSPTTNARQVAAEYRSAPRVDIPIRTSDPVLGANSARVRLVVFSSFQCPACQTFAEMAHRLNKQYPNDLAIVFKHFPLGKDCNPSLKREMQPRACAAAFAAEGAKLQNAFWPYHDRLFRDSLRQAESDLKSSAVDTGLDIERWDADRQSRVVRNNILGDVVVGANLQIDGTPAIFLNGRRITHLSYPILQSLIEQEIEASNTSRSQ